MFESIEDVRKMVDADVSETLQDIDTAIDPLKDQTVEEQYAEGVVLALYAAWYKGAQRAISHMGLAMTGLTESQVDGLLSGDGQSLEPDRSSLPAGALSSEDDQSSR